MKPENSSKKAKRSPGAAQHNSEFQRPRKGANLQQNDYLKYSQLSPQKAIILAVSIVISYILIAVALALVVSPTIALIASVPLIAIAFIAAVIYWLSRISV